jgi:DNA (cytosine-5)-methyltransferase 1
MIGEATKQGYAVANEGDSINLSVPNSATRRGRVGKGVAQTLDTGMQQYTYLNARIRRLTPTEAARLQGFSDDWCSCLSDSAQYHCYGNAVTTNVVAAIIKNI